MIPPPPARRPPHQPLVPATEAIGAEARLEGRRWRTITGRHGTMIGSADHPLPQGCGPRGPQRGALKAASAARRARGGRAGDAPARAQQPAHAGRGSTAPLSRARGRAPRVGGAEAPPGQPAGRHAPEAARGDDQGAPSAGCGRLCLRQRIERAALDGGPGRRISSRRKSSASTTSRAAPRERLLTLAPAVMEPAPAVPAGRACTGMRS